MTPALRLLSLSLLSFLLTLSPQGRLSAETESSFDQVVRPLLAKYCIGCHGPDSQEADLRLDSLESDFSSEGQAERWTSVVDALHYGEMPPEGESQPSEEERKAVVQYLTESIHRAAVGGRLGLRRMNRVEYERTVRDLLAVDVELAPLLPEDGSAHGFDNVGEALTISSVLVDRYLEAAEKALTAAEAVHPPAESTKQRFWLKDEKDAASRLDKGGWEQYFLAGDYLVDLGDGYPEGEKIEQFRAPSDGEYRFSISVWPWHHDAGEPSMGLTVYAGTFGRNDPSRTVGVFDVQGSQQSPHVVSFSTPMKQNETIRLDAYGPLGDWRKHFKREKKSLQEYPHPGVAIGWIEVEGPLGAQWPPESHRRIYGDLPLKQVGTTRIRGRGNDVPVFEVESKDPKADSERLLQEFVRRAFRRPVTAAQVQPYVRLVHSRLDTGYPFREALRLGQKAVLCAPDFLMLNKVAGDQDDYAIASRLSYFLWSTMPDESLMQLARSGRLHDRSVLRQQVQRLLEDPRSEAFVDNFVGQWLDMRLIDDTTPDGHLYPEFNDLLKRSMVEEAHAFFREMLTENESVLNIIDSDWAMLNERMAEHYGVPGVRGYEEFRRVTLPSDSVRGGVMTQAGVMKVTANGTTTSPVIRGVWMLENILGRPAPPPPAAVPAVEPDIRGATTIREQLKKHRADPSCASCHAKIDPLGFALENFDVIGGFRENYRSLGEGERVPGMRYRVGPAVEPHATMDGGQKFENIEGLREILLANPNEVARAMVEKLVIYSTGAPVSLPDRAEVNRIVDHLQPENFGLRSMIHEVVQSELFLGPNSTTH